MFSGLWEQLGEYEVITRVAWAGAIIGFLAGFIMQRTNFCTMGALSDINAFGDKRRFRAWMTAIAVAIILTQALSLGGYIDLKKSIYLGATFNWLSLAVGGFIFGVGMVYASGCGAKNLIRLGGGDLKGLVSVLVIGFVAYMTLRGLLAPVRVALDGVMPADVSAIGDTGLQSVIAKLTGMGGQTATGIATVIVGILLLTYAFKDKGFRTSPAHLIAGIGIGLLVAAGWWATGVLGHDEFDPMPLFSLTFIAPSGNTLQYLMTFTGATISFSIATVFGMIAGAFAGAVIGRQFAVTGFADRNDLLRHLVGATMMGFGGVTAVGCTVGQGITGVSTLALGSVLALVAIIVGGFAGFKLMERGVLV